MPIFVERMDTDVTFHAYRCTRGTNAQVDNKKGIQVVSLFFFSSSTIRTSERLPKKQLFLRATQTESSGSSGEDISDRGTQKINNWMTLRKADCCILPDPGFLT